MTPLPAELAGKGVVVWRLERTKHLATWQTAEGAFLFGGRWSSEGTRVLYTSIDPATAILEVAVHKGFDVLDTVPHTLLGIELLDLRAAHVVQPGDVPNPNWLLPITPRPNQQAFGDKLLATHPIVVIPSAVSRHSWNVLVHAERAAGAYRLASQEAFALDPRLTPGAAPGA